MIHYSCKLVSGFVIRLLVINFLSYFYCDNHHNHIRLSSEEQTKEVSHFVRIIYKTGELLNKIIQNPQIFHSLSKNTIKDKMDITTKYTTQEDSKNPFSKRFLPSSKTHNAHLAVQEWAWTLSLWTQFRIKINPSSSQGSDTCFHCAILEDFSECVVSLMNLFRQNAFKIKVGLQLFFFCCFAFSPNNGRFSCFPHY